MIVCTKVVMVTTTPHRTVGAGPLPRVRDHMTLEGFFPGSHVPEGCAWCQAGRHGWALVR
jgi:hypothetical protein